MDHNRHQPVSLITVTKNDTSYSATVYDTTTDGSGDVEIVEG